MAFGHQRTESLRLLLREIAQSGPIPRIDLAARTGISRATVTTITADLLQGGLITDIQRNHDTGSTRGRPRVDLTLNGAARHVAGVKVGERALAFLLMDFEGRVLTTHDHPLPAPCMAPGDLARHMRAGLEALADAARLDMQALSGVGVALAGLLQAEEGLVYWSPSLDQRNVSLRDTLEAVLGCPVFMDNDANLVAMGEAAFGMGRDRSDFIVITNEGGVGMGVMLGGQIYRGTRGSGGEFGHMKVHPDGAPCRCGQAGCLEAYVADYALQRAGEAAGLIPEGITPQEALAQLSAASKVDEDAAQAILSDAARMFGMGLANLVNIFDPELIILAGEAGHFAHLHNDTVLDRMRGAIVDIDKAAPEVVLHEWGPDMWAQGAAGFALEFVRDLAVLEGVPG